LRSELYSRTRFQGTARESVRTSRGVSFSFGYFSLRQVREKYLGHRDQPRLVVGFADKKTTLTLSLSQRERETNSSTGTVKPFQLSLNPLLYFPVHLFRLAALGHDLWADHHMYDSGFFQEPPSRPEQSGIVNCIWGQSKNSI
jgi:hypothetical protein